MLEVKRTDESSQVLKEEGFLDYFIAMGTVDTSAERRALQATSLEARNAMI
ncbi:MAG: hypothetical protein QXP80_05635 [Zestosphaera sp.]